MKTTLRLFIVAALALTGAARAAQPANAIQITQWNSGGTATTQRIFAPAAGTSFTTASGFATAIGAATSASIDGYFADPSTNASFSASAWRTDLALVPGTNVEVPLTFSTGLTRTTNTVTVNASQIINTVQSAAAGTQDLTITFRGQTGQLLLYQDSTLAGRAQYGPYGSSSTGTGNTSYGVNALSALTLGTNAYNNAAFGANAGASNTSGYQNAFFASSAGSSNTTGFQNTAIGQGANYQTTTSSKNTALGFHANLSNVGTDGENTALGHSAMSGAVGATGGYNTAVGAGAMSSFTTATENVALGRGSLTVMTTGARNVAAGHNVGLSLTTGSDNIFMGWRAGYTQVGANATTTGSQNIFIGTESGASTASQLTNAVAIGYRATVGASNTTVIGNSSTTNTIIPAGSLTLTGNVLAFAGDYTVTSNGVLAGRIQFGPVGSSSTGTGNTVFGYGAGIAQTLGTLAYNNTFLGTNSGRATTTGYINTFVGSSSGNNNTTGFANTFIGQGAGFENLVGTDNVSIGHHAGLNSVPAASGGGNVYIGASAGLGASTPNSTGTANVFIGQSSGSVVSSGSSNSFVGRNSGFALTTGSNNSIIGQAAGFSLTTGGNNVFLGWQSGYTATPANATTTGGNNVFVGYQSGSSTSSQLTNAIAIGYQALVGVSNTTVLGNSSTTNTTIPAGTLTLTALADGTLSAVSGVITSSSDARLKFIEADFTDGLQTLRRLQPAAYRWRPESGIESEKQRIGFIAQNVRDAIPQAVSADAQGTLSLDTTPILAATVNAVKELDARTSQPDWVARGLAALALLVAIAAYLRGSSRSGYASCS